MRLDRCGDLASDQLPPLLAVAELFNGAMVVLLLTLLDMYIGSIQNSKYFSTNRNIPRKRLVA